VKITRGFVTATALRQEIFSLGGRHRGEPLAGALEELTDPTLTTERRLLLRAVVEHLAPDRGSGGAARAPMRPIEIAGADVLSIGIFVAAVVWVGVVLSHLVQGG
jgi:hypothetical protein